MVDDNATAPADLPADPSSPQDELDALLSEFETKTAKSDAGNGHSDPAEPSGDGSDIDWLLKQVELSDKEMDLRVQRAQLNTREKYFNDTVDQYIAVRQQEQHEADLKTAIAHIRGDLDAKFFDDKFVTAFLDKEARENTKLQELWQNRLNNPRALATAINELAKGFQKTYSRMPDANLTEDREAVAAAVRGASVPTQTEPPPKYGSMGDNDLRNEMRKLGIQPNF